MPGTVVNPLFVLTHLIFTNSCKVGVLLHFPILLMGKQTEKLSKFAPSHTANRW